MRDAEQRRMIEGLVAKIKRMEDGKEKADRREKQMRARIRQLEIELAEQRDTYGTGTDTQPPGRHP